MKPLPAVATDMARPVGSHDPTTDELRVLRELAPKDWSTLRRGLPMGTTGNPLSESNPTVPNSNSAMLGTLNSTTQDWENPPKEPLSPLSTVIVADQTSPDSNLQLKGSHKNSASCLPETASTDIQILDATCFANHLMGEDIILHAVYHFFPAPEDLL